MKKISGVLTAAMALSGVAVCAPNTYATVTTLPAADENGVITLTDDVELSQSGFRVASGENITLNLNGYTLTSSLGLADDLITVELGGTLTINGKGTVDSSSLADNYAALFNNGTTIVNGGNFMLDLATNKNSYYVVVNHGEMTITGGNFSTTDNGSSMLENGYYTYSSSNPRSGYVEGVNQSAPTLTINNGTFSGGMNTIKNDEGGVVVVNDGTFSNTTQVPFMNWGTATINGGTFEAPTGSDKTSIANSSYGLNDPDAPGKLTINGGTFNAEYLLETRADYPTAESVEINGGNLNYGTDLWNTRPGYGTTNAAGEPIETAGAAITGTVYAPVSALSVAQPGATVYVTDWQEGSNFTIPEGVEVYLAGDTTVTEDGTDYVMQLVKNEDGTYTVVKSLKPIEVGDDAATDSEGISPQTGDLNLVAILALMAGALLSFVAAYRSQKTRA